MASQTFLKNLFISDKDTLLLHLLGCDGDTASMSPLEKGNFIKLLFGFKKLPIPHSPAIMRKISLFSLSRGSTVMSPLVKFKRNCYSTMYWTSSQLRYLRLVLPEFCNVLLVQHSLSQLLATSIVRKPRRTLGLLLWLMFIRPTLLMDKTEPSFSNQGTLVVPI